MPNNIIIWGEVGVGKSTLIKRLLSDCGRPVAGFITLRRPPDEFGQRITYIHPASAQALSFSEANLVGSCSDKKMTFRRPEIFDSYGVELLTDVPTNSVVLMDEIGFMENDALAFQKAVISVFESDVPVIAAVKSKQTPFLESLRNYSHALVVRIDEKNRDELFGKLLPVVMAWK